MTDPAQRSGSLGENAVGPPERGPHAVVRTGALRGAHEEGICIFRGIPFAAPPTGARRLLAPAPAACWEGERDATRLGAAPPQTVDALSELLGLTFDVPMSEDCLQLNVFTPAPDAARRPVMVWLHGGAFATGSGTAPGYSGHRIALRGDVVVVTLNYRVGALGFLHLEPFLGEHGEPGAGANLGLQDQIAALRWVRDEIAVFGGDPERITVFGESAGAGSLVSLLAMPAAKGLFQRAIIQSAAPEGMLSADEGAERCLMLLEKLGIDAGTGTQDDPGALLHALQQVPVERLLDAQNACLAAGPHRTGMFFAPVVDGVSLPRPPIEAITEGCARDVEILIGTTSEEMQLYSTVPGLGDFPDPILEQIVASRVKAPAETASRVAREAIRVYREELTARNGPPSQQALFFALESDLSLRVPATTLAAGHARRQPATFMYLFTWESPLPNGHGGTLGACHALDLPFTFGALEEESAGAFVGTHPPRDQAARLLSEQIRDAWVAFAREGDPSHPGLPSWPAYLAEKRATMVLGEQCAVVAAPREAERAVWDEAATHTQL